MVAESEFHLQKSLAKYPVKAIIYRLRRGAITYEQAKEALGQIIKEPKLVDAILDAEARIYTISPGRLITMMEYIPIKPEMFKQKLDAIGVPEDEQKLLIPYAFAREIKTELDALWRAYKRQYVDGLLTEDELKTKLDELATLWGRVTAITGLDWILYSPGEREVMIKCATEERKLKEARMVLTPKELVGMKEYVPVPPELLQKRLLKDVLPEQERKLVKAFAFAKEVKSEMYGLWRAYEKQYVEGLITENDLKQALDNMATLWGEVTAIFGVNWIIFSPDERKLMIATAKRKREIKLAK